MVAGLSGEGYEAGYRIEPGGLDDERTEPDCPLSTKTDRCRIGDDPEGDKEVVRHRRRDDTTEVHPAVDAFTIVDWTSSRRNITNKYILVFTLRPDDKKVSSGKAKLSKVGETSLWCETIELTQS